MEIKKCVCVGPGGILTLDEYIKNYNNKYIVEYKKGFKLENGQFDVYPILYTIDFPVQKLEVSKMKEKMEVFEKNY